MSISHSKRICTMIKVKPEKVQEYKEIHANVWPGVLAALKRHNVADYSIHFYEPMNVLVAHMKYIGPPGDFEKDMDAIAEDEETQRWWKVTDPMQESFTDGATGSGKGKQWWVELEEVFRLD